VADCWAPRIWLAAARRVAITDGSIEDGKRAARTIWVGIIIAVVVVAVVILYIITR
jgi:hypothetical protein